MPFPDGAAMKFTFLAFLAVISCSIGSIEGQDKPNILFFMADDVGCDALGSYGGQSYKTPRLDELASGGMRFTHCYSMPVCHPTRICLLTGRYPFRTGNPKWGSFPIAEERNSFAHVMKDAGYATAIAGKWQICMMRDDLDHAQRLGFDESCFFGWHEGPRYHSPMIYQNGKLREGLEDRYGPDVYTEFLIDFMTRNKGKPFLAYYSMALCHDVTDDLKDPVPFSPQGHYDTYKQMVEKMDVRVGRLIDALERLGLREKTVVLFTTDNGTPKSSIHSAEQNPDPTKKDKYIRVPVVSKVGDKDVPGGKGNLTNDGTNVPLIASWPGTIKPGQVVDDLVDFSDFFPTLADLGEGDLPHGVTIDGQSFAGCLAGDRKSARSWAFAEHRGKHWVRTRDWKLYSDGRLFDMKADPREQSPVAKAKRTQKATAAITELQKVLRSLGTGS
jgi:arylsulfatase A-like enzyme